MRRLLLAFGGALTVVAVAIVAALVIRPPASGPTAQELPPADRAEVLAGPDADATAAPDLAFEGFDGGAVHLEDWHGTPLVVNFWASWCPPCVAEMRDVFEPAHCDLDGRVALLGVNLQDGDEAARDVIDRTGVTYELARDPDGELFTAFGGFGMPTTVFLDAQGRVAAQHTGAITREEFDALIQTHFVDG